MGAMAWSRLAAGVLAAVVGVRAGAGVDCPGDVDGAGAVNSFDLNAVLAAFGQVGQGLSADVNRDGAVDSQDLNIVLDHYGDCPVTACCQPFFGPQGGGGDCDQGLTFEECVALDGVFLEGVECPSSCSGFLFACSGDPKTNSCCQADGMPGCDDAQCCALLCSMDPFCCQVTFDAICAAAGQAFCGVCGGSFGPHDQPGSNSNGCEEEVCAALPHCCEVTWDLACVAKAVEFCWSGGGTSQWPLGPCCVGVECRLYTEDICLGIGGVFEGPSPTCSLTTCP